MKVRVNKRKSIQGGVLVVTICVVAVLGLFLFYYLNLVTNQRTLVARSQAWNLSLAYAESGAEEVLAHLNPGAPQTNLLRSANGWGSPVNGIYGPAIRNHSAGTYSVVFTDDRFPTIYSTGTVTIASIPATLTRVIQVTTTNSALFNAAMAVKYNINFNGNGVATDSFDSSNPSFSTNGRYDSLKTSTNGDVASFGGVVGVNNGDVHGSVLLGPTATDTISANGLVTGSVYNDFNYEFEDVVLPTTTFMAATALGTPQTIDGVAYDYVFQPSAVTDYSMSSLSGSIYVASNTTVRLKITGNASPSNIRVASGGSLAIYMDGQSFSLSGSSTVDGGLAANLSYYGTTNNTSISISGNASFTGTIYAPEAAMRLTGGGSSTYDIVGAIVAQSISVAGHFKFHFDEALRRAGPMLPYVASSWREI